MKTENNEHINLKVAGQDGSVVQFKIKRHTPLSKLMKAYCERQVRVLHNSCCCSKRAIFTFIAVLAVWVGCCLRWIDHNCLDYFVCNSIAHLHFSRHTSVSVPHKDFSSFYVLNNMSLSTDTGADIETNTISIWRSAHQWNRHTLAGKATHKHCRITFSIMNVRLNTNLTILLHWTIVHDLNFTRSVVRMVNQQDLQIYVKVLLELNVTRNCKTPFKI